MRKYNLDVDFAKFHSQQSNVFFQDVLLQFDVGSSFLKQKFDFRNNFFRRPEVVASVEVGQLAVATGEEIAAFAEEGQLFGLKMEI